MSISDPITYSVVITGAVDNLSQEKFATTSSDFPTTYNNSKAIARSNIRYHEMIGQLLTLSDFKLDNISSVGRTKDAAATSFSFNLTYYRDRISYLKTADETNPGTYLTGIAAIKRVIARALSTNYYQNFSFWDPTVRVTRTNTNTTTQTTPPRGWAFEQVDALALFASVTLAEAAITIS